VRRLRWLFIAMIPVAYLGTCSFISREKDHEFAAISVGNSREQVIAAFGSPSSIEDLNHPGADKYGARPCNKPCAQRLWFTNKFSLGLEAWSVELDGNEQVIRKSHWVSP
jgi:hypothetical protein